MRDRNRRPEGGWMGADQNFFRNRSVGLYPRNHLNPSHLGNERIAMDKLSLSNNDLGNYAEAKRVETQNWTAETGQTGLTLRSDRSHRSDRWKGPVRPVRPVAPRKLGNKTSKVESRVNEVQIQRNLEDTFTTVPWTYPQEIFPKRLTDREKSREDKKGLGFSQELKISNSYELAIPGGLH